MAGHRLAVLAPLAEVLDGYAPLAQRRYAAWRQKQALVRLPEQFAEVLHDIIEFGDPAVTGAVTGRQWAPSRRIWQQ